MISYEERLAQAIAIHSAGLKRAAVAENAPSQKFPKGTRVKLLSEDRFFIKKASIGTIEYSYSQAYGNLGGKTTHNDNQYSVCWDNHGSVAWFSADELEKVDHEN